MDWMKDAEQALRLAAAAVFGLDPETPQAADFVRLAYREGSTNAQAPIDKNVVYLALGPRRAPETGYVMVSHDGAVSTVKKTVPLECLFTFYGPDAIVNAERLWQMLFFDGGFDTPRFILREHHLVPVSLPDRPVPVRELDGGNWRQRADVRYAINLLLVNEITNATIDPEQGVDIGVKLNGKDD